MKRFLTLTALLTLILSFAGLGSAAGQEAPPQPAAAPGLDRWTEFGKFKSAEGAKWRIDWNERTGVPNAIYMGETDTKYTGPPEQAARRFLADHRKLFRMKKGLADLEVQKVVTLHGTRHVRLQQTYRELPVKDVAYLVHIREDGRVDMANGTYYPQIEAPTRPAVSETAARQRAINALGGSVSLRGDASGELVVYPEQGQFRLAWKLSLPTQEPFGNWHYYVDAISGEVLEKQNQVAHATGFGTVGRAKVEEETEKRHPEVPSTEVSSVSYVTGKGNIYPTYPGDESLNYDVDLPRLDGTGYLEGKYVSSIYNSVPGVSRAYEPNHDFTYNTSNDHFSEVNAYYHIDKFRNEYIDNLGFSGFTKIDIELTGSCDEFYSPSEHKVVLGNAAPEDPYTCSNEGDAAREEKAMYHEYTHAVVYDLAELWTTEDEAGAISEGTPDYFAHSFVDDRTTIFDFAAPTNRNVADPEVSDYDEYQSQNWDAWTGGEFFSAILWDLRNTSEISEHETDMVVIGAVARLDADPTFAEFRDAMKAEDSQLYSGIHSDLIHNVFANRGIGSEVYYAYIEGPSQIPPNQSTEWEAVVYGGTPPYSYEWYKDSSLDGTSETYTTSDAQGFNLFLEVTDANGDPYVDPRYITVSSSSLIAADSSDTSVEGSTGIKEFALAASPNPFTSVSTISYTLPQRADVTVGVYNLLGQRVSTLVDATRNAGEYTSRFHSEGLASGTYFVRFRASGRSGRSWREVVQLQLLR